MGSLKEDQSPRLPAELAQFVPPGPLFGREKTLKNETVCRKAARAEDRSESRDAGDRNDADSGLDSLFDQAVAGIGESRSPSVANERDIFTLFKVED